MSARRKRHEEPEEHVSHERWLITYADMITLLMVLFIVLFAIGQTDLKKFAQLRDSLNSSLGALKHAPISGAVFPDLATHTRFSSSKAKTAAPVARTRFRIPVVRRFQSTVELTWSALRLPLVRCGR